MKYLIAILTTLFALPALAEQEIEYALTGGFHAVATPAIVTGSEMSAFVYEVKGASILSPNNGESKVHVSIDCLGFDELGAKTATVGTGRCLWRDSEDHHLYVSVGTRGDQNVYTITGGTGKWTGATGEITSNFKYLPSTSETEYLGTDVGAGKIRVPN